MIRVLSLLVLMLSVLTAADRAGPATAAASAAPVVAYIEIEGVIDDMQKRYVERALTTARERGAQVIVTHITSPGGLVTAAEDIVHLYLDQPKDGPRQIAWVDREAWSAAAMIAYAHHEVHLGPSGKIGDIGVIFQTGDSSDPIKYAPEKIETAVRAMLRSIAQNRGWNEAKMVKMTARNQELYKFSVAGKDVWVIEDDLPQFLSDHPDIDPYTKVVVKNGQKDRLMSYTAQEAVAEGMATSAGGSLDDLYARVGTSSSSVVDLTRTTNENVAWALAAWAPILASITILCIVLELKMGSGIFIIIAACTGAAFLFCQFYLDMANALDIVLIVLGLAIIMVDLFILPTGGILAATGACVALAGLFMSFMANGVQFNWSSPQWAEEATSAFRQMILSLFVFTGGALVLIASAPRLGLFRRVAVQAEITSTSDAPELSAASGLIGRTATCRSGLHPGGFIILGPGERAGEELSATAEHGEHMDPGTEVVITAMQLGEAVVRRKEQA
jgi:membrane-bound serine protease (ClpP class)